MDATACREYLDLALEEDDFAIVAHFAACPTSVRDDIELCRRIVSKDASALRYATPLVCDDEETVKLAVKIDGRMLMCASRRLQDTTRIVKTAMLNDLGAYLHASSRIQNIPVFALKAMACPECAERVFPCLSKAIRSMASIAKAAVLTCWNNLEHVSETLRDDDAFVKWYVKNTYCEGFEYISHRLRHTDAIVKDVLPKYPSCMDHVNVHELVPDSNIPVLAARTVPNFLARLSPFYTLQHRDVAAAALEQSRRNVRNIPIDLLGDMEFVEPLLYAGRLGLLSCAVSLKEDRDFVLRVVKQEPSNYADIACMYPNDHKLATEALQRDGRMIKCAPVAIRTDPHWRRVAVADYPRLVVEDHRFGADKELCVLAIQSDCAVYTHTEFPMRNDKDVVLAFLESYAFNNFGVTPPKFIGHQCDRDILIRMLETRYPVTPDLAHFSDDKGVMLAAVDAHGLYLEMVSDRLRSDPDIVGAAVRCNPDAIHYAPKWWKRQLAPYYPHKERPTLLVHCLKDQLPIEMIEHVFGMMTKYTE